MAITVNGQIYRNLQEQVQYLTNLMEEIKPQIDKALVIPQNAPATESLVAIDTTNAQSLLTVGNGLTVANNTLASNVTYALDNTTLTITNQ